MFVRLRVLLAAAVILVVFGGLVGAQVLRQRVPVEPPIVLSGNDVGFRITGRQGSTPVGTVVVKIDGQWYPVEWEFVTRSLSNDRR